MSRLNQLLDMLKDEPNDTFLRYALAMEYAKLDQPEEALTHFNQIIHQNPDYVAAYFMAGRSAEQKSDIDLAKAYYRRGIDTAQRIGDSHAAGEISAALMMLE